MADHLMFIRRYNRLHEITRQIIAALVPDGQQAIIPFIYGGGGYLDLGFSQVAALLPDTMTPRDRDHLIMVHLGAMESYLYRHGYEETGHFIRITTSNYGTKTEEERQEIIRDGWLCNVGIVSSAEDFAAFTPLKRATNEDYTSLYDKLMVAWGGPDQKTAAKMMRQHLSAVHQLLPKHKIGNDFERERNGRWEPLPMYVRNEIHHPTINGLLGSKAFQQDKNIGYAIMEAWLP